MIELRRRFRKGAIVDEPLPTQSNNYPLVAQTNDLG
jgi:hypothetical protein